jgi:DNA-binding CsgD family transcriptional regulator
VTYIEPPAITPSAPTTEPDVAVARLLGSLTARFARQRDKLLPLAGDTEAWGGALERGITILIDSFSPLVPEYRGRAALDLLREEGAARLVSRLATSDPSTVGRHGALTVLSVQLSAIALRRGATSAPLGDCTGVLEAFFDGSQRRAVRRVIERIFERSGAEHIRIDFAAGWRTGDSRLIRMLEQDGVAQAFEANGPRLFALVAWLFLADCWAVSANPVSVAYLTGMQVGYERWHHGSDAFRQALTEALVVATSQDVDLDGLDDVGSAAWAAVLTGELIEWAGSVLMSFQEAMEQPGQLARFRVFEFVRSLERAGKRGRRYETVEEHLLGLAYRVVRLDDGDELIGSSTNDPGQRIPELHELRCRIQSSRLTRRERQVLALRIDDLDFATIGKELHMNPATARVLMHRVRRSMGTKQIPRRRSA